MPAAREYELVLMLDPGREDVARDALAQEARAQIEAEGTLKQENNWGLRKMAYEIDQRTEADYRWFRFEAPVELLDGLNHNLRIADGVLRFRIFKVDSDTPTIAPPATGAAGPGASRDRGREAAPQAADEPPTEEPAQPVAEPAEPGGEATPQAEEPVAEPAAESAEPAAETPEPTPEPDEPAAEPAPVAAEESGGEGDAEPAADADE